MSTDEWALAAAMKTTATAAMSDPAHEKFPERADPVYAVKETIVDPEVLQELVELVKVAKWWSGKAVCV